MADFTLPPVTDLASARALIQSLHDTLETKVTLLDNEEFAAGFDEGEASGRATAYSYAAQLVRDVLFQFPEA